MKQVLIVNSFGTHLSFCPIKLKTKHRRMKNIPDFSPRHPNSRIITPKKKAGKKFRGRQAINKVSSRINKEKRKKLKFIPSPRLSLPQLLIPASHLSFKPRRSATSLPGSCIFLVTSFSPYPFAWRAVTNLTNNLITSKYLSPVVTENVLRFSTNLVNLPDLYREYELIFSLFVS